MNDHTDSVDDAAIDDSPFAANEVCNITARNGANECTKREDGDDEGRVRSRDGCSVGTLNVMDEDLVSKHTVDISRIVAEEDTTEGGKSTDQVGLEGHRSFDTVDIGGGLEDNRATRGIDVAGLLLNICHIDV